MSQSEFPSIPGYHLAVPTCVLLAAMMASLLGSSPVAGSNIYNFEDLGTGNVLATLDISSLPGTHANILSLSFSPAGQSIFGYGPTYTGTFDVTVQPFSDDGSGGIGCAATPCNVTDGDPPNSSHHTSGTQLVNLSFITGAGFDTITVEPFDFLDPQINRSGDWRFVPEPSSLTLAALGVLGLCRRRRKRA